MLKRLGERLFNLYCHPDFQEDIKGDLEEYYIRNLETKGERYANRKYFLDTILLFRFSLLRDNWISQKSNIIVMVRNNIKVTYRSMMRQKFYTLLNITGLAISMAACVLIAIYVQDETSYDKHLQDSETIYRIVVHSKFGDNEANLSSSPSPMARALKADFPEVEEAGRTQGNDTQIITADNKSYQQKGITWADQEFFDVFKLPLLLGNSDHLLDEPNTVVLQQKTAEKLFGEQDPIGKIIRFDGQSELKVTGVIQDIPENTHFAYEMFISLLNNRGANNDFWLGNNYTSYVKLNDINSQALVEGKLPGYMNKHVAPQLMQYMGIDLAEKMKSGDLALDYRLQPVERIHLYSNDDFGISSSGSVEYVYMFGTIGLFILLIACINFVNMATARGSVRAKEIGVRKVLGSKRKQLIGQFLTESLMNSLAAFCLAILLVHAILPGFNQLTEKSLVNPIFGLGGLWPYLSIATILVGLAAGIYPAFVLSSYRPIKVLKGETTEGNSNKWLRNTLVVVQFSASGFLIIASMVVYSQLDYLQNKELGFNKDQILVINETELLGDQVDAFKTELERTSFVESVTVSGFIPSSGANSNMPYLPADASSPDESVTLQNWFVDHDYAKTFGIEILEGRFFSPEFAVDTAGVVINETALRQFGYEENPIGKRIKTTIGEQRYYTIIGVVKDFHLGSLTKRIQPQIFLLGHSPGAVNIKFRAETAQDVLKITEANWEKFASGLPFDYNFLDQIFDDSFRAQEKVKTVFTIFALLAISISCLGLFGLAAYISERRKKEMGIRKVLGASMFALLQIMFNNVTRLISLSALIAIPIAYYFMQGWLTDFAYAISLGPWIFVAGALSTLMIAWLTVGFQSLKAARRNPVDNLRSE